MPNRPLPILTDKSNAFAHYSQSVRVPTTIQETLTLNPDFAPGIRDGLIRLREEVLADEPVPMIHGPATDYESWAAAYAHRAGQSWLGTDWFFAEIFFYRHLIEITRWFETGRDPFAPKKDEEFSGAALWHTLDEALATREFAQEERLGALVEFDLWGNRIDLSYAVSAAHGAKAAEDDLLANDIGQTVALLMSSKGTVHIICDNCGTELAMDCALTDALLETGHNVWLHVKAHPTFVSDTVVADVHHFWKLLLNRTGEARALGERQVAAFETGRLRVIPDFYWNSSRFLWDMPPYLERVFKGAAAVFLKGDANYRRAVGDAVWPTTTPFGDVVRYFPAPLVALRTLKSDAVVGLAEGMEASLDAVDPQWRVNGKRGVIQGKF